MQVTLKHVSNPDIDGGYWEQPKSPAKERRAEVDSFKEASELCQRYIEFNGLGGGNWAGGQIFENGKQIAFVSYNGRVWEGSNSDWSSDAKEIEI